MIKKILFILFLFCSIIKLNDVNAQSVVTTESFDNTTFVPTGWALKPAMPQALWVRNIGSTFPTVLPHSGAGLARFRSRVNTQGMKQQLVTKSLDYLNRGTSPATVSFWMYRDDSSANYDSIAVYANNADSINANAVLIGVVARNRTYMIPDVQTVDDWYQYTFSIPTSFTGNTTTHIIFEGNCENPTAGQGENTIIDDISYLEYPMPCTGTPNVGTIVNAAPTICNGAGTTTLTVSSPISGAGITYLWLQSNAYAGPYTTFGGNTPSVTTGTLSIKTYFKCYVSCAASGLNYSTNIDSSIVSTNVSPVVTVSPSPAAFCAGTAGVIVSGAGANTYSWSPAIGLNATTGVSVTAMPTSNTQYTCIGTDANGCTASTLVNVVISNPPVINFTTNPSDSICAGGKIIVNSGVPGGGGPNANTFLWSDGKTTRRDTVTVTSTMMLHLTVTNQLGCSSTDSIQLFALPAQNSGFSYTQTGNTFTFTDTTTNSSAWYWDFGDGNSSTNQNPTYTFSAVGTYTVTFVVVGPCKTDTITKIINIYPESVSNVSLSNSFACFPNPANDIINIYSEKYMIENVKIINIVGEKVSEFQNKLQNKTVTLSIKDLPKGIYTLQLNTGKSVVTKQFTKQ